MEKLADYAHSKNIKIGGYSLFSSRRIDNETDVIDPKPVSRAVLLVMRPALAANGGWHTAIRSNYFLLKPVLIYGRMMALIRETFAHQQHTGHKGLDDSQWRQMEIQKELYRWLNESGGILMPLTGIFGWHTQIAIGYREVNFSLPRENQKY